MSSIYSNIKRAAQRRLINHIYGLTDRGKLCSQKFMELMIALRQMSYRYKDDYLSETDKIR